MDWYVLFVKTGEEELIVETIKKKFCNKKVIPVFLKRIVPEKKTGKIYNVLKPLFPGYILVQTSMTLEIYHHLTEIPYIFKLLNPYDKTNIDNIHFFKMKENEISSIIRLTNQHGVIDYSSITIHNAQVTVQSGPLKGNEASIKKIKKHTSRAVVQLDFMGTKRAFEVGIQILPSEQADCLNN